MDFLDTMRALAARIPDKLEYAQKDQLLNADS